MPAIPDGVLRAPHSAIRSIGALASTMPDAIQLQVGDPDFITPAHIIDAAAAAARAGSTKYTPSAGFPSLREAVAAKLHERNGIECAWDEVVITTGGCGGLATTLLTLLEPGDAVLVPDPGWANYQPIVHAARGVPVLYPLDASRDFAPDLEALERFVTPRTKVLLVNTPGNPTGTILERDALVELGELAARHDLWLLSDECYDELVFEGEHVSLATVADPERVVSIFTFSKSYAMTGWRIGYLAAPSAVAPHIARMQEPVVANASSVSQRAAEAALRGPQDCVAEMRAAYRRRRDAAAALLDAERVRYVRPRGAFYLMVDVSTAGDDEVFCRRLLEERRVAIVPGSAFGPTGAGFARVCLSADQESILEGLRRASAALTEWS